MSGNARTLLPPLSACLLATTVTLWSPSTLAQQERARDFSGCVGTVFSAEEDFVSPAGEKRDGNPVVSREAVERRSSDGSRCCARHLTDEPASQEASSSPSGSVTCTAQAIQGSKL